MSDSEYEDFGSGDESENEFIGYEDVRDDADLENIENLSCLILSR